MKNKIFIYFIIFYFITPLNIATAETVQYIYDDLGQLIKAIDSPGTVIEYVYDPVGNIIEVKRSTIQGLAIFGFTPSKGPVGTKVVIQGQGFAVDPLDNDVSFDGAPADVQKANANTLEVTVPVGATTGPIAVTVAGNTAQSDKDFAVLASPAVTSLDPPFILAGATVANVRVTGRNLSGASFVFEPAFVPPILAVNSVTVDPLDDGATISVTATPDGTGQFVLVATNSDGHSAVAPTGANTMSVLIGTEDSDNDGLTTLEEIALCTDPTNADSDGDGFVDGDELAVGTDPCNQTSTPDIAASGTREITGSVVSALNEQDPTQPLADREAVGATVTVLNEENPTQPLVNRETVGATVSVLNEQNPTEQPATREAVGATVSVLNEEDPTEPLVNREANGAVVSVDNQIAP